MLKKGGRRRKRKKKKPICKERKTTKARPKNTAKAEGKEER